MTRINAQQLKAIEAQLTPEEQAQDVEILRRLEDGLRALATLETDSGEWLNEEDMARIGRLRAFMTAQIAAYGSAGLHGGSGGAGVAENDTLYRPSPDLPSGWNGNYLQEPNAAHETFVGSSYAGTIRTEMHGTPAQTRLLLKLREEQNEVVARAWGNHIIIEIKSRDGTKETWVVEDGLKNGVPIVVDATEVKPEGSGDQGVKIDFSRIMRIRPQGLPDNVYDFYFWGSDFKDDIRGSQGPNSIVGMLGEDILRGGAARDLMYGDDVYETAGQFSSQGANDKIWGGGDDDTIMGGAGIDTWYASDRSEAVHDTEPRMEDEAGSIPNHDRYYARSRATGWDGSPVDGMVVLRNTSGNGGGTIDIDMRELEADGYRMAFAEARGNDIIITFVGEDANGNPKTFKMKIEGILSMEDPVMVNVHGTNQDDILDFSRLDGMVLKMGHVFNLQGEGGNDLMFGVQHRLVQSGVDLANLSRSGGPMSQGVQSGELQDHVDDLVDEPENNKTMFNVSVDSANRRMEIIQGTDYADFDPATDTLVINAPEDYEQAYLMEDGANGHYLVLVKPGEPAQTMVVHINLGVRLGKDQIQVRMQSRNSDGDLEAGATITKIFLTDQILQHGFEISGGAGNDSIYYQEGSRLTRDAGDSTEVYETEEDVLEDEE